MPDAPRRVGPWYSGCALRVRLGPLDRLRPASSAGLENGLRKFASAEWNRGQARVTLVLAAGNYQLRHQHRCDGSRRRRARQGRTKPGSSARLAADSGSGLQAPDVPLSW